VLAERIPDVTRMPGARPRSRRRRGRCFARKRAETDWLAQLLRQQAIGAAARNPTRYELVERIVQLVSDYNAGSVNIDEYLRRLFELSQTLTEEEERSAREGMTEEELAIFDLLTQPDPVLTDDERDTVKASAKKVQLVFDHVLIAYGQDGTSAYTARGHFHSSAQNPEYAWPLDVNEIADDVVARIHDDTEHLRACRLRERSARCQRGVRARRRC
jgi:type I restriction enzyme, R subunit